MGSLPTTRVILASLLLLLLTPSRNSAEPIISVTHPEFVGWIVIYSGQGYRTGWSQTETYEKVSVSAKLGSGGPTNETGRAYLTTRIGPGTTMEHQVAFAAFTFPADHQFVPLFQDLRLGPGTYYLCIVGDSHSWGSGWAFGGATNIVTAPDVASVGCFGVPGGNVLPFYPASEWYVEEVPFPPEFIVTGNNINHPSLQITPIGGTLSISWGTNFTGFTLETAIEPDATDWQPVTDPVETAENRYTLLVDPTDTRFYRLKKVID